MSGLFDNDPVFLDVRVSKPLPVRNRAGRFCTKEQKHTEEVERENRILKRNAELYRRNWFSESDRATRKDRENFELKNKLKLCQEELKKLRRALKKMKK